MSSAACCASSTWGSRRSTPRRTWTCWLTVRRSEEHTSELQSRSDLVCRLLLEKKKKKDVSNSPTTNHFTDSTGTTNIIQTEIACVHDPLGTNHQTCDCIFDSTVTTYHRLHTVL